MSITERTLLQRAEREGEIWKKVQTMMWTMSAKRALREAEIGLPARRFCEGAVSTEGEIATKSAYRSNSC